MTIQTTLSRVGASLRWAILLGAAAACVRQRIPLDPQPIHAGSARAASSGASSTSATSVDGNGGGGGNGAASGVVVPLSTVAVLGDASAAGSAEADLAYVHARHLVIPVAGVAPEHLSDSFGDARDGSRRHRAIDILAPRGTPVLAADDGSVLRMSWNSAGGNTIYTVDDEHRIVYYYAHLDHYRDGLSAGAHVARGDTLGFVGTTGNAPRDVPHLHFQIMRMARDGKYWNGEALNPYELLR